MKTKDKEGQNPNLKPESVTVEDCCAMVEAI
jgi:hypothetical protein